MKEKQLKDKAIKIKGKDYVQVKDRVLYLSESVKKYSITTKYDYYPEKSMWVVKATLITEEGRYTGLAQEVESNNYKEVNHTSALENCETSAVGRACAMAGIGVLDSIASIDEINKATNRATYASIKQITWMRQEAQKATGFEHASDIDKWIEEISGMKPNLVPSKAVMGVINKIRDKQDHEEKVHEVVVTDLPEVINFDDLPY